MSVQIVAWRCLDCGRQWNGSALVTAGQVDLNEVGQQVRDHVLDYGHTTAPVIERGGQLELWGAA